MDFSYLDDLPTFNDRPDNHRNIPYPNLQIISGKSGSGKTHMSSRNMPVPGQVALNDPTPGKRVHSMTPPPGMLIPSSPIKMKTSLKKSIPK